MDYLSYSGYKTYADCPRSYWHKYVNKTKPPKPDNRVGMLYGGITGVIFERFYVNRLWRSPDPVASLRQLIEPVAEDVVRKELRSGTLNWKDPKLRNGPKSMKEVIDMVYETVPNGLNIIRRYRLVGTDAKAEVKLDSRIEGRTIAGRADFLMRRLPPDNDLLLIDGKGSAHRDKYVDVRQLFWYAMLHRYQTGALPDKLAFLYWRSEPSEAIDWVTPTSRDIDDLISSVRTVIGEIETLTPMGEKAFQARAKTANCRFCPFVFACPEGKAMMEEKPPKSVMGEGVEDVTLE